MSIPLNPWTWVLVIFSGQTLGAILFAMAINLEFSEVAFALAILALGTGTAVWLRLRSQKFSPGKWVRRVPAMLYAIFIFAMSQKDYPVHSDPGFDLSLFHPVLYATLGFFLCLAHHLPSATGNRQHIIPAVLGLGTLYGALDELHQSFIPGRTASLVDLGLDVIGLLLGLGLFFLLMGRRRAAADTHRAGRS
jgi:VanZ family protein